ncbi:MAG: glycosyltransferase family 39 protein [Chloroflexota bacterium]|nr:glycosyltransferase family 39 protein [Chloroflexota bacterium]
MRRQIRDGANVLHRFHRLGLPTLILFLAFSLVLVPANLSLRTAGAFILTCLLPGFLLGETLFGNDDALDVVERLIIYVGLGYVSMVLGTLLLHYIPGPLPQRLILGCYGLLITTLLLFRSSAQGPSSGWHLSLSRKVTVCLISLVLLASFYRFTNLGYSEFQGDEGRALLRAAEILQGNDEALLLHKKGPVEILVPAALYASMRRISEATARLPFALANLVSLLALFALGRRLFDARIGLLAMALMTIDGFCIGFSRIVQYQSVVFLMILLTLFCTYRGYQTKGQRSTTYLLTAVAFTGTALLAHYEGFFALPGAVYIVRHIAKERGWSLGRTMRRLGPSVLLGSIIVGIFYIPFALHPHFSETLEYLTQRRVGVGDRMFQNNITDFFWRASYYNASYYPLLLGILLLSIILFIPLRTYKTRLARTAICTLGLGSWLIMLLFPSWWGFGLINFSVLVFLVTGGLLLRAQISMESRVLAIWFGSAALLYFFLMVKVHTHYYVALIPWSLIAAVGLSKGWDWIHCKRKSVAWAIVVLGLAFWLLCAHYVYIVFVRHCVEYHQKYPIAKPTIYWTPFDKRPEGGYFGFPYRTGWKAIGGMYDAGVLQGTYDSNQEDLVTNWYTRGAMRCPQGDYFIIARDVEDPHEIIPGVINGEYMPVMEILREGEPQLWVFQRGYEGPMQSYDYATYAAYFDRQLSAPIFHVGAPLDEVFEPTHQVNADFGGHFQLVGWNLDPSIVAKGGRTILTLYWRTLKPTPADYHVFVHVGEGDTVTQQDSVPRCGQHPTYRWKQGEEVVDRYLLTTPQKTPLGVYPIRVGMYDFGTKDRLTIHDAKGRETVSLLLTHVRIGKPQMQTPDVTHPYAADLGGKVRLLGYDLPKTQLQPGDSVPLTLYWECLDSMGTNYTVFVHLRGPDGEIYGQRDTFPLDGRLPTTFWVPQETLADPYSIDVASDAPEGAYSLVIGMYEVRSGKRLPATRADGTRLPSDQILLPKGLITK